MSAAPKWAVDLLERVCADEGAEVPDLTWRRSRPRPTRWLDGSGRLATGGPRPEHSSGRYFAKEHRIVVTAGSSRKDQKLVLLHETAHALTPGHHHDETFWTVAFTLFRRYGVPIRYARQREYGYRKTAIVGDVAATIAARSAR